MKNLVIKSQAQTRVPNAGKIMSACCDDDDDNNNNNMKI
jgi:hypothetical protein